MPLDGVEWQLGVVKEEDVRSHVAGWRWEKKSGCICGASLDATTMVACV